VQPSRYERHAVRIGLQQYKSRVKGASSAGKPAAPDHGQRNGDEHHALRHRGFSIRWRRLLAGHDDLPYLAAVLPTPSINEWRKGAQPCLRRAERRCDLQHHAGADGTIMSRRSALWVYADGDPFGTNITGTLTYMAARGERRRFGQELHVQTSISANSIRFR
jgi:hypothetical protein